MVELYIVVLLSWAKTPKKIVVKSIVVFHDGSLVFSCFFSSLKPGISDAFFN